MYVHTYVLTWLCHPAVFSHLTASKDHGAAHGQAGRGDCGGERARRGGAGGDQGHRCHEPVQVNEGEPR